MSCLSPEHITALIFGGMTLAGALVGAWVFRIIRR